MMPICEKMEKFWKGVIALSCIGVLILFWGCGDYCLFGDCDGEGGVVTAIINATPSSPTTCQEVDLDGSGSIGVNLTYLWSLTDQPVGSTVTLTSTESAASFTPIVSNPPSDDTYTVQLTVKNAQAQEDIETVGIEVAKAPYANPGNNQTVTPGTVVTLDGSGSKNPETTCTNSGLVYYWEVTAVVPPTALYGFDNQFAVRPKFSTDLGTPTASYTIKLTVTTVGLLSGWNTVNVTTAY